MSFNVGLTLHKFPVNARALSRRNHTSAVKGIIVNSLFSTGCAACKPVRGAGVLSLEKEHFMLKRIVKFAPIVVALALTALPNHAKAQDLIVGDYFVNAAYQFSPNGTNLGVFASSSGTGRFYGMHFDASGDLYVAGGPTNNVRRFSSSGIDLGDFATAGLDFSEDVVFDKNGDLYVSNFHNSTIRRFSSTGADKGVFATLPAGEYGEYEAFDSSGDLYVGTENYHTVERYSSTGQYLGAVVSGFTTGGIAFDTMNNLYVGNQFQNTILRYSPTGAYLGVFASTGISQPEEITFDASGNLYVANAANGTVREFSSSGTDLGNVAAGLDKPTGVAFRPAASNVPEPGAFALLTGAGFVGTGLLVRRRRFRSQS